MAKKVTRILRPATVADRQRHAQVRRQVSREFPPSDSPKWQPAADGVGAQIRAAREAQGLSWYKLAKLAGIPNSNTVRDIESGRDVKLSNIEAVAKVLGMKLELTTAR